MIIGSKFSAVTVSEYMSFERSPKYTWPGAPHTLECSKPICVMCGVMVEDGVERVILYRAYLFDCEGVIACVVV